MRRVYLAGPDVFFPNVCEHAHELKMTCNEFGLEGVFPLDANVQQEEGDEPRDMGTKIFLANTELIDSCGGMIANISPWRGPSADVGTAFEIGYAYRAGKKVIAYTNDSTYYHERVKPDGYLVENFEMIDNLMIYCGVISILDSFREAAECLAGLEW
jgi:nucleoside 2-deoxyribosyltransferase